MPIVSSCSHLAKRTTLLCAWPQAPIPRKLRCIGSIQACRFRGHAVSAIIRCQGSPRASTRSCHRMHARRRRPSSVHALPLRSLDTSFSTEVSALASLASLVYFVAMPLLLFVVSRQHPLRRTAGEYLHVNRMASRRLGKFSSVTRNRGDPASYCSCLPSLREIHSKLKTNPPQTIDHPSLKRWPLPGLRHRS